MITIEQVKADDAKWFIDKPTGARRVRRIYDCERRVNGRDVEREMNIAIVKQIEPGMRTRNFLSVPPDHVRYVLKHGEDCLSEDYAMLLPGCTVNGKVLDDVP